MENISSNSKDIINIKVKYNSWFIEPKRIYIENLDIKEILSNNLKLKFKIGDDFDTLYLTSHISPYLEYKRSIFDINDFKLKSENYLDDITNIEISIESENNLDFNYQLFVNLSPVLKVIK